MMAGCETFSTQPDWSLIMLMNVRASAGWGGSSDFRPSVFSALAGF
jgi:hypothetical protein